VDYQLPAAPVVHDSRFEFQHDRYYLIFLETVDGKLTKNYSKYHWKIDHPRNQKKRIYDKLSLAHDHR
jgi:hypothetical protein